jgi:2,3-bisphosphoglycerate-independent phosphoglycerate mutase
MTVPHVALIVLDGWGLAPDGPGNAVSLAKTPVFDELWSTRPHTQLTAMGPSVGLPEGQMGNSEVGHLNLGAGAIVPQDLARIDAAVEDGSMRARSCGTSDRHLKALIELAGEGVIVHAFTDGRDTSPTAGAKYLADVEAWGARVGSVIGRYYAMDRDKRWDRVQKAYDLLVHGKAEHHVERAADAATQAYERDETDEFIAATIVGDGDETRIRPGDSVIAFNFRPDRMREITLALCDPSFTEIDRGGADVIDRYVTLAEYDEEWDYPVVFPPQRPSVTIGSVIAAAGLKQLHVAETEKYPHVTYFFNGGEETPYDGEVRELAPSPRDVATYDLKPEMAAREAADAFVQHFEAEKPAFSIINFANPDMVGHTGVIEAAVKAVETVDEQLGRVVEAVHAAGGACIVTADHGNCDHMLNDDGSVNTAHSLNPVPFIVTAGADALDGEGILADVAPTALALLGIEQPAEMTGRSLLA